jgi:hypothetical protein
MGEYQGREQRGGYRSEGGGGGGGYRSGGSGGGGGGGARPPREPGGPPRSIPPKIVDSLMQQAKKAGLVLQTEDDNTKATLYRGETAIAGPFTHGQSVQACLDGYKVGIEDGRAKGVKEGAAETLNAQQKAGAKPKVCVVKTGNTFHSYLMVNGDWALVEHGKNPAFTYGGAVDAAIECHKLTEIEVTYFDRTDEIAKA